MTDLTQNNLCDIMPNINIPIVVYSKFQLKIYDKSIHPQKVTNTSTIAIPIKCLCIPVPGSPIIFLYLHKSIIL